jgi:tRNA (guanine-N7-)-methyltransferase
MTKGQARALRELVSAYLDDGVEAVPGVPLGIEVGFGMGDALVDWAQRSPAWRLYGIDLYQPGIAALAEHLHRLELQNVRILEQPAQLVLRTLAPACVDEVRIYFPDPWPKKRHFKRRLIQPAFVDSLARALKPGGVVRLATDWTPYAEWIREAFQDCRDLQNVRDLVQPGAAQTGDPPADPDDHRPQTKFEDRGRRLGHPIHDLAYQRTGRNSATTLSR